MTIKYESEFNTVFAITQQVVYRGQWCEELLWAEIDTKDGVVVRWEDDYMKRLPFNNLAEAKIYIERDHLIHKPHVNGKTYDLKAQEL